MAKNASTSAPQPSERPRGFREFLHRYTSLDIRSLALFRIALGVVLFLDIVNRAVYLRAHYTDFGLLPRGALLSKFQGSAWFFSLHLVNGTALYQGFLFALALVLALFLILGLHTRLATVGSWVLLISLHSRNYMVLQGGDDLLRLLLFWGMFLPLGAALSLDSIRKGEHAEREYSSLACFALILQIASMYISTMLFKIHPVWYQTGTAVEQALRVDQFTKPLGYVLLEYPEFLQWLTRLTVIVEWAGGVFILMPFLIREFRFIACVLLIGFHLVGLQLTMELGLFPWICAAGWLAILPSLFWRLPPVRVLDQKFSPRLRAFATRLLSSRGLFASIAAAECCRWKSGRKTAVLKSFFIVTCLLYMTAWNVRELYPDQVRQYFPVSMNWFAHVFRIDQRWSMFSPQPLTEDGWYVIPGELRDGTEVNVFNPEFSLTYAKPADVAATYPSQRWRKYMMNIWMAKHEKHRLYYGKYLCRSWNESAERAKQLMTFQIIFMREDTLPDGSETEPEKVVLWNHYCFDKEKKAEEKKKE